MKLLSHFVLVLTKSFNFYKSFYLIVSLNGEISYWMDSDKL